MMLYKKYHRNFVRKFKVGVEFIHRSLHTIKVTHKPFIARNQVCIGVYDNLIYYLISKEGELDDIITTHHVV